LQGVLQLATILVVDDDPGISTLCRITLQQEGHKVWVAVNGREALLHTTTHHPDLIVLDLRMPVVDGTSFFGRLEALPKRPPVLILSAFGAKSAQEELGAEASLAKPFEPTELVSMVNSLLAIGEEHH
jgi:DNA-binding response OmpR family regulator